METTASHGTDLINLRATELRLGLPGLDDIKAENPKSSGLKNKKRTSADRENEDNCRSRESSDISEARDKHQITRPASKKQVVGWPPVRNSRKNTFQQKKIDSEPTGTFVKVSVDGAPYLRKVDLAVFKGYKELLEALELMFKFKIAKYHYFEREGNNNSEYEPTYEDKDGDCMLVGDVPWDMFTSSCKRLRIMRCQQV